MPHRNEQFETFSIGVVADMVDLTPQTIRQYESMGFLAPQRSDGGTRQYTREDIERLQTIRHLTNDLGVNLAGVEVVLKLIDSHAEKEAQMVERFKVILGNLHQQIEHFQHGGSFHGLIRVRSGTLVRYEESAEPVAKKSE